MGPRARTDAEREFLALGEPAEEFIRRGAAAGSTMLPKEIIEIVDELLPAHGPELVARAVARAARFGRFKAADVRSILAIGTALPEPAAGGDNVVVGLPAAEVRSFDAYRIGEPGMTPRDRRAGAGGRSRSRAETVEAGRDPPRRPPTSCHRQHPTLDARRDPARARRRRDRRP